MKVSKRFYSSDDLLEGYEVHIGEVYDEINDVDVENAFIFDDGYRKRRDWFKSWDECIAFIEQRTSKAVFSYLAAQKDEIAYGSGSVFVTKENIEDIVKLEAYLETANSEAKRLYYKYRSTYNFTYLLDVHHYRDGHDFIVYNWHILPCKNVFFVNATQGEPLLKTAHFEKKKYLEMLSSFYEVECEILASDLSYVESNIIMRGLMFEYVESGHYVLGSAMLHGFIFDNQRSSVNNVTDESKEIINQNFIVDDFFAYYLKKLYPEDPAFDDVSWAYLRCYCCLDFGSFDEGYYCEKERRFVTRELKPSTDVMLHEMRCQKYRIGSKSVRTIIVPEKITMTDYIYYHTKGLKIIHESSIRDIYQQYFNNI